MRTRISSAHILACLALFVALGGTGYAAVVIGPKSVGARALKKNAVTTKKVKNRSLLARDFKRGQLPRGATGPTGATGARGADGPQGVPGPSQSREVVNRGPVELTPAGTPVELARLRNLEPGAYVFRAVASLVGSAGSAGAPVEAGCSLQLGGNQIVSVEAAFVPNTSNPLFATSLTVPLQRTAQVQVAQDVALSCSRFSGGSGATASNGAGTSLIATKVGSLSP